MDKSILAASLVDLWDEYMAGQRQRGIYQPTMTDFVAWVREKYGAQESEQRRKSTRTSTHIGQFLDRDRDLVITPSGTKVKFTTLVEPGVAHSPLNEPPTKETIAEIRNLYGQGFSVYRIRNWLNLVEMEPEDIRRISEG